MITQPIATVIAGGFVVIAAVIAFSSGVFQRRLDARKHTFASRADVYRESLWEFQQVLDGLRNSVRLEHESSINDEEFDVDSALEPVFEHFRGFQRANLMVQLVGSERIGEELRSIYLDFVKTTLELDPNEPRGMSGKFLEWEDAMESVRSRMRSDLDLS